MPPLRYHASLLSDGLTEAGPAGWAALIVAAGSVLGAIGIGFKWVLDRFLTELSKRDQVLTAMQATMKAEGDANRGALEHLKAGFESKLDDMAKEHREDRTLLTDRQFALSKDALVALTTTRTEVGEVKQDVAEVKADVGAVKADVAAVKAEVHEIKVAVSGEPKPRRGQP